MADNLREYLNKLLSDAEGIIGIYFSDKDGVLMIKATTSAVSEQAVQPYIQTTFISAVQQANKMGLGKTQSIITRYQDMIICQFNFAHHPQRPIYATVIGSGQADIGVMLNLEDSLLSAVQFLSPLAASRMQSTNQTGQILYR